MNFEFSCLKTHIYRIKVYNVVLIYRNMIMSASYKRCIVLLSFVISYHLCFKQELTNFSRDIIFEKE